MIESTYIKPNELMFYFEEYRKFKGIDFTLVLYKIYKKVIGILKEIHSGYYAIFAIVTLLGLGYIDIQKNTNVHDEKNINNLSLLNVKKGKFVLNIGIPKAISYGLFFGRNETVDVLCIFGIFLASIYATHIEINRPIKNDFDV